jgi:predicted metalloprotease with PDZ domain
VGDELLAINGFRISAEQLPERLRDFKPGQTLSLTFFHQDQLCTRELTLQAPQPSASYILRPIADATAEQQNLLVGWLGETARELFGG